MYMLADAVAFKINKTYNINFIFSEKEMVTSLANIFTMEKLFSQDHFWE